MVIKVSTRIGQNVEKLHKPPYTDPYVRWCEETGVNCSLLLDRVCVKKFLFLIGFLMVSNVYAEKYVNDKYINEIHIVLQQ
jgi:hypothetical protein